MDHQVNRVHIQQIGTDQALALSVLAKNIYKEYYLHLWEPGGAEWYQDIYAYHPDKLYTELADKNNLHFMVYENAIAVGYLKLKIDSPMEGQENALEIERIYLHKSAAGKGIGKQLMQMAEKIAIEKNQRKLFLKAMDRSVEAIGFYRKMGFTPCGTLVLPFENMKLAYRGMLILCKQV